MPTNNFISQLAQMYASQRPSFQVNQSMPRVLNLGQDQNNGSSAFWQNFGSGLGSGVSRAMEQKMKMKQDMDVFDNSPAAILERAQMVKEKMMTMPVADQQRLIMNPEVQELFQKAYDLASPDVMSDVEGIEGPPLYSPTQRPLTTEELKDQAYVQNPTLNLKQIQETGEVPSVLAEDAAKAAAAYNYSQPDTGVQEKQIQAGASMANTQARTTESAESKFEERKLRRKTEALKHTAGRTSSTQVAGLLIDDARDFQSSSNQFSDPGFASKGLTIVRDMRSNYNNVINDEVDPSIQVEYLGTLLDILGEFKVADENGELTFPLEDLERLDAKARRQLEDLVNPQSRQESPSWFDSTKWAIGQAIKNYFTED